MSNAVWFYTDASRQQQGPVDETELQRLWRDGRIDGRTLVWREGQKQWIALSELALAMPWQGALAANAPPPLPPLSNTATPQRAVAPSGKRTGCLIALAVGAVLCIPMLGILAAIALPAYQDYTTRARISEALASAAPLKLRVDEVFAAGGECPEGTTLPSSEHSTWYRSAWLGPFEGGHCGLELVLADGTQLQRFAGQKFWLWRESATSPWRCSSEIADRWLPASCRD